MTTSSNAQEAASSAAGEGKHVAGVAKDEARNVASEAASQARTVAHGVLNDVSSQVSDQSRTQQDRLGSTLAGLGDDLEKMAAQADSGLASDLAREAATRARTLGDHLQGREPAELLEDVRRFARQRPGTFLLGALGAGVVAGRLLRGAKDGIEAASAQSSRPAQTDALASTPRPTYSASAPARTGTTGGTGLGDPSDAATRAGVTTDTLPTQPSGDPLSGERP